MSSVTSDASFKECKKYARALLNKETAPSMAVSLICLGTNSRTYIRVAYLVGGAILQVRGGKEVETKEETREAVDIGSQFIREMYNVTAG